MDIEEEAFRDDPGSVKGLKLYLDRPENIQRPKIRHNHAGDAIPE